MRIALQPLAQQVMVITGASSGISPATALVAAHQGASLVLAARSQQTLDDIAGHLAAEDAQVLTVEADVGDALQMEQLATAALARFGRINTWVNNAGVSIYGRVDEVGLEDARRLFDTNFWGVVQGSRVALPHLRLQGGALIHVGSEASEATIPLHVLYSVSKHAVKAFTDGLRLELEVDEAPVPVTLIQPTAVDTPYPEHAANYLQQAPKLRTPMLQPEQVAAAILEAATTPTDAVRVGVMAKVNTTLAKLLPALGERMAKLQMGRQQRDELPRTREGTLYRAGESGRVHGRGNDNAADREAAQALNTR